MPSPPRKSWRLAASDTKGLRNGGDDSIRSCSKRCKLLEFFRNQTAPNLPRAGFAPAPLAKLLSPRRRKSLPLLTRHPQTNSPRCNLPLTIFSQTQLHARIVLTLQYLLVTFSQRNFFSSNS